MADCSEHARMITRLAMLIGADPAIKDLDGVVLKMQEILSPDIRRDYVVNAIVETMQDNAVTQSEIFKKLAALKKEARTDKELRDINEKLEKHLKEGTLPEEETSSPGKPAPETIQRLRALRDDYQSKLANSTPGLRKTLEAKIANLEARIKDFKGRKPQKPGQAIPNELQALQRKHDELSERLNRMRVDEREAANLKAEIAEMEQHIEAGTLPPTVVSPEREISQELKDLREARTAKRKELARSEPAAVQKLQARVDKLKDKIANYKGPAKQTDTTPYGPFTETRANLQAEHDKLAAKLKKVQTDAQEEARLTARIAELEGHIKAGTTPAKRVVTQKPTTPENAQRKALIADLQRQLRPNTPDRVKRLIEDIAELENQLDTGIFPRKVKMETKLSPEVERLELQKELLQKQIRHRIEAMKPIVGFWGKAGLTQQVFRMFKLSFDLGTIFRQAKVTITRPMGAIKNIPLALSTFSAKTGELEALRIEKLYTQDVGAPLRFKAELGITMTEGKLGQQEEAFNLQVATRFPWLRDTFLGIERVNRVYLNLMRAYAFDTMVAGFGTNGSEINLDDAKALAHLVNVFTGRGSLGATGEKHVELLNAGLLAPRFLASKIQFGIMQPLWGTRSSAKVKAMVAMEYARYGMAMGVLYMLAGLAGADIEDDPRSSDFMKIRVGNTRIDPLGGATQILVLASRLATQKSKGLNGKIYKTGLEGKFGDPENIDLITRFLRAQLNVLPALALDLVTRKDIVGKPVDVTTVEGAVEVTKRNFVPLGFQDIYKIYSEHGIPAATSLSILALLGVNVQVYDPKKPKSLKL